jgi:cytochrome c oxidase subunit 2
LRRAGGAVGVALGAVLLSGCASEDLPRMGLPEPGTDHAEIILSLWQGSWIAALAVGALVWGLILWCVIVYRRRSADEVPVQLRYNVPIELLYTVVPVMMVLVLFFYTARDESKITSLSTPPQHTVDVVAYKWSWTFNYLDDKTYDVGTNATLPQLWLPVNESVRFQLRSPDVIHSFWVIPFLMKMDVVPGHTNQFQVTPTKTGVFQGKCAELCGVNHSRMLFEVHVVTAEQYAQHMVDLRARDQVGQLIDGRVSDAATGRQGNTEIGGTP